MKKPTKKLLKISNKLDGWLREEAWPLWWKQGRKKNGLFYEALDFTGTPVPGDVARVRVQARQIYSMALAWKMGFRKKSLPKKLETSINRFYDSCIGPEGLPGMLVDIENGELTDPQPNLYVTAFTLMALAQSRKVLGGRTIDSKIGQLLDNIDRHLALPDGNGYRETLPSNTIRHQNPHMHLFESLLVLFKATSRADVHDRAESLLNFMQDTFFDSRSGVVQEKVNPNLEMTASQYEPGHSMEWIWLLGLRSRLFKVPLDPFAVRLYVHYRSAGIPPGQAPMCMTVDHKAVDPTRRLWSQTESLKAHLTIAELGPAELALPALHDAIECAENIHDEWLDTEYRGTWYDHLDANGELIAKDVPGSMCYHLYLMVMELSRSVKKLKKKRFA